MRNMEAEFNPSTLMMPIGDITVNDNNDEDEDQEERRIIEQEIDERLKNMDDDDLQLDESDPEEDSITGQKLSGPSQTSSTPKFNFQTNEQHFLQLKPYQESQGLEILYHARGEEIKRLRAELAESHSGNDSDSRRLMHEVVLLKADKARLEAKLEHFEAINQGQLEQNTQQRKELENLNSKLSSAEETKSRLMSQLESSDLLVKTLQAQLQDLQKSETILKAKQHHEQVVRSLRERHETETHNLHHEVDRLQMMIKQLDNELESARSKNIKLQRDHELILMEKSDTIKELQDKLDLTQKRLAQHITDSSSQGYVNIKAMQEKVRLDQEKYATDLITFQQQIDDLKARLHLKETEATRLQTEYADLRRNYDTMAANKDGTIGQLQAALNEREQRLNEVLVTENAIQQAKKMATDVEHTYQDLLQKEKVIMELQSRLRASDEKYKNLKTRVRHYQHYCRTRESKLRGQIDEAEGLYKSKLNHIKSRLEQAYVHKNAQIEEQVLQLRRDFQDEITRAIHKLDDDVAPRPTSGSASGPVSLTGGRPESATEELAKLFEEAKLSLADSLKRPHQNPTF